MNYDQAYDLIIAVENAHDRIENASAYTACKSAGVTLAAYKEARLLVYGINLAV